VSTLVQLRRHVTRLRRCDECPDMIGPVARCLSDQHHGRYHRRAGDDRADHVRALVTPAQPGDVSAQLD
jgi:hypothetical protein